MKRMMMTQTVAVVAVFVRVRVYDFEGMPQATNHSTDSRVRVASEQNGVGENVQLVLK